MFCQIAAAERAGDLLCRAGGKAGHMREQKVPKIPLRPGAEGAERGLVGGVDLVLRLRKNVLCAGQNEPLAGLVGRSRLERSQNDAVLRQQQIGVFSHDLGV